MVGAPCSCDTTTIQRLPVQAVSLRCRSCTSVLGALASSAISSWPSSQRTSRTSRSSAIFIAMSRFSCASAISASNEPMVNVGAAAGALSSATGSSASRGDTAADERGEPRGAS